MCAGSAIDGVTIANLSLLAIIIITLFLVGRYRHRYVEVWTMEGMCEGRVAGEGYRWKGLQCSVFGMVVCGSVCYWSCLL